MQYMEVRKESNHQRMNYNFHLPGDERGEKIKDETIGLPAMMLIAFFNDFVINSIYVCLSL
jgi:hypothetical protein